jgi:DNA-binding NarL/FixJ family response regulator
VATVSQGATWGIKLSRSRSPLLSEREVKIMALLACGMRDHNIANHLIVSESTVKFHINFHINNVLGKLHARRRYQALYQATPLSSKN